MKLGRGIGVSVVVLLVVLVGIVFYVVSSLDSIVAAAIEKYGSQATQTPVQVSAVNIDLKSGRLTRQGFFHGAAAYRADQHWRGAGWRDGGPDRRAGRLGHTCPGGAGCGEPGSESVPGQEC